MKTLCVLIKLSRLKWSKGPGLSSMEGKAPSGALHSNTPGDQLGSLMDLKLEVLAHAQVKHLDKDMSKVPGGDHLPPQRHSGLLEVTVSWLVGTAFGALISKRFPKELAAIWAQSHMGQSPAEGDACHSAGVGQEAPARVMRGAGSNQLG
jgi:hypothetical protein